MAINQIEMTEDEQLELVRNDGSYGYNKIKNPSENATILALVTYEIKFKHISNPSEKIQMAAIICDPNNIKYMKNPSIKSQTMAIKYNVNLIKDIRNLHIDALNSNKAIITNFLMQKIFDRTTTAINHILRALDKANLRNWLKECDISDWSDFINDAFDSFVFCHNYDSLLNTIFFLKDTNFDIDTVMNKNKESIKHYILKCISDDRLYDVNDLLALLGKLNIVWFEKSDFLNMEDNLNRWSITAFSDVSNYRFDLNVTFMKKYNLDMTKIIRYLDKEKHEIIKSMLEFRTGEYYHMNTHNIEQRISSLRKVGIKWKELKAISDSVSADKAVAKSHRKFAVPYIEEEEFDD